MGCRGVAVLPAGMSQERFDWLDRWIADPADVDPHARAARATSRRSTTPATRSAQDPDNFVLNQFCEFGNHLAHLEVTGRALERVFEHVAAARPGLRLAAFVSATGSAGTIAAGDVLKERHGTRIVAVEALECPTMLENGFGEHNIQGIGDKHIPLIHNVMNTDVVCAISDRATDELDVLFNTDEGRAYLAKRHGVADDVRRRASPTSGSRRSATCWPPSRRPSCSASVPTTPSSRWPPTAARCTGASGPRRWRSGWPDGFGELDAAEVFGRHLGGVGTDDMIDCTERDRHRIFNLGYYTWVEQQGTPFEVFEAAAAPAFWQGCGRYVDGVGRAHRRVQRPRRVACAAS